MIEAIVLLGSRLPAQLPRKARATLSQQPAPPTRRRLRGASASVDVLHVIDSITTIRSFHPDACPYIRYLPFLASAQRNQQQHSNSRTRVYTHSFGGTMPPTVAGSEGPTVTLSCKIL
jgi:hypothetical protein